VIEKNSIWGEKKKSQKIKKAQAFQWVFFVFLFFLLGGKNLTSKAILSQIL